MVHDIDLRRLRFSSDKARAKAMSDLGFGEERICFDGERISMRQACPRCSSGIGVVEKKSGQEVVRCSTCGAFVYNRPKEKKDPLMRELLQTFHNWAQTLTEEQRRLFLTKLKAKLEKDS